MKEKELKDSTPLNPHILAPKNELGAYLHTALRKVCDSTPTSLAYNVISICDEGWEEFLEVVWRKLNSEDPRFPNRKDASLVMRSSVEEFEWGTAERNTLKLVFDGFSDLDWNMMTGYIWKD